MISFQDKSVDLITSIIVSRKVTFSGWENNSISNYHDFFQDLQSLARFIEDSEVRYIVISKISTTSYCHWNLIFPYGVQGFQKTLVKS